MMVLYQVPSKFLVVWLFKHSVSSTALDYVTQKNILIFSYAYFKIFFFKNKIKIKMCQV